MRRRGQGGSANVQRQCHRASCSCRLTKPAQKHAPRTDEATLDAIGLDHDVGLLGRGGGSHGDELGDLWWRGRCSGK